MSFRGQIFEKFDKFVTKQPGPPQGFNRVVEIEDDQEMSQTFSENRDTIDGWMMCLEYEDARGKKSTRDVQCYSVQRRGDYDYLAAHCFVRDASRSFRFDRIVSITDYDTGEIYNPPGAMLSQMREMAGLGAEQTLFAEFVCKNADFTKILVFLGRASGRFVASEREVIVDYLINRNPDTDTNAEFSNQMNRWIRSLYPSTEAVVDILFSMKTEGQLDKEFMGEMKKVLAADGKFQTEERDALSEIGKLMREK
ncbi:MAG: WYL domain-containing protein [Rhizobiales bacterium]|nr:WYL domain-containing protein [Hyphomicrobiales bacterium]